MKIVWIHHSMMTQRWSFLFSSSYYLESYTNVIFPFLYLLVQCLRLKSLKSGHFRSHLISWPSFITSLTWVALSLRLQERWAPLHSSFWGLKDSVVEKNFKDCQGQSVVKVRKITKCNELYYYQLIIISVVHSRETKTTCTLGIAAINGQVFILLDPAAWSLPRFPHPSLSGSPPTTGPSGQTLLFWQCPHSAEPSHSTLRPNSFLFMWLCPDPDLQILY